MKYIILILSICFTCPLACNIQPITNDLPPLNLPEGRRRDELATLDQLIVVTKLGLESELNLRKELVEYLEIQKAYMQNTHDKEKSFQMVRKASDVFKKIQENHLTHIFDPEFLSELAFFSQIAKKWDGEEDSH